jgi:uncharacterized membrane protein (UPF0127 family)
MKKISSFFLTLFFISHLLVAGEVIEVNLMRASCEESRAKGLMDLEKLEKNQGLFMDFELSTKASLWAKRTAFDLDVAFLDDKGTVIEIQTLKSHPEWNEEVQKNPDLESLIDKRFFEEAIISKDPCRFAIEMNKGWFLEHNITDGDALSWTGHSHLITELHLSKKEKSASEK